MAPTMGTTGAVDALQDALLGSDDWGGAQRLTNAGGTLALNEAGECKPVDASNTSLEMESSFLMRTGREPSNEEIMEYLEKHQLQAFLTDVIMHVAKHFPPDPYQFLLDHIEAMVMKYDAARGKTATDPKLASKLQPLPQPPAPVSVSPEQQAKVVKHLVMALENEQFSADKLFGRFAGSGEKMLEPDCTKLLEHLESAWGLQPEDTRLMLEVLKRWRFRANAAKGTRGLPLWPLQKQDFVSAYPSLLRSVRDRYVPIGGQLHRSLFIKQAAGKLEERYDLGATLGQGAYGEVRLATLKATKERRVCKIVGLSQQKVPEEEVLAEVELLRGLDHPHIIRVFEFFATKEELEIIMEPVFGGTLTHLVQELYFDKQGTPVGERPEVLTESWLATALSQLLSALAYAHDVVGVVHKDLKCDNALLVAKPKIPAAELLQQPVHVMLADFGIAEVFQAAPLAATHTHDGPEGHGLGSSAPFTGGRSGRSSRVGGTPSYMSPEMFKGSFSAKSDLWSLGVMVYQLMTGELPYRADNLLMQAHAVCNPRRHPNWELLQTYKWGLGARWLCQQLLCKDEAMRPSAAEALRDNWLSKASTLQRNEPCPWPPSDSERKALQHQHLQSHLMKMAMACITSQLNLSQLHHLNLRFKRYDGSGDGRLSHIEMRQALSDVGVVSESDKELIIESLDGDHSGLIEYSEFVAGCVDLGTEGFKDHLHVAFSIFDLDGSNSISLEELRRVLTQGPNSARPLTASGKPGPAGISTLLPDGKTVEEVMKDLDANRSKAVEYAEFEAYLLDEHKKAGERLGQGSKK